MITLLLYSYTLQSSSSTIVNAYCDDFCLGVQFSKVYASSSTISGKKVGICYQASDWSWSITSSFLEKAAELCHINASEDATAIPPQIPPPMPTPIPAATPQTPLPPQTAYPAQTAYTPIPQATSQTPLPPQTA